MQDLEEAKSRTADVEAKYSKQVDKLQGEIKALSQRLKASTGSAEQALQAAKDKADELKRAMKQAQADADKARKAADAEHKKAMREANSQAEQDKQAACVTTGGRCTNLPRSLTSPRVVPLPLLCLRPQDQRRQGEAAQGSRGGRRQTQGTRAGAQGQVRRGQGEDAEAEGGRRVGAAQAGVAAPASTPCVVSHVWCSRSVGVLVLVLVLVQRTSGGEREDVAHRKVGTHHRRVRTHEEGRATKEQHCR